MDTKTGIDEILADVDECDRWLLVSRAWEQCAQTGRPFRFCLTITLGGTR